MSKGAVKQRRSAEGATLRMASAERRSEASAERKQRDARGEAPQARPCEWRLLNGKIGKKGRKWLG